MSTQHPESAAGVRADGRSPARAVVADGHGGFSVEQVVVDAPARGEVRVDIKAAGVCHTDLDGVQRWCTTPTVLGHEGAGVVTAVGAEVHGFGVGDHVLLTWAIACGHCFQCSRGEPSLCEILGREHGQAHAGAVRRQDGTPVDLYFNLGTMATTTLVRSEAVVPIPRDVAFESACLLGCAVMTGYGSVVNAAKVGPGASVAVIGCGGVGLNVLQSARLAGARRVVAIDVDPGRFDMARRFGATDVLRAHPGDPSLLDLRDELWRLSEGRGLDFAFECTGVPALAAAPLTCVRNGGTAIQVSGIEQQVSVDMTLFEWDKTYLNPLYGKCRPAVDFGRILDLYRAGSLLVDELVSSTYPLESLDRAFADMQAGRVAKGVLLP